MENRLLQVIGFSGAGGAWFISISDVLNTYLTTLSLLIGISLGIWALCDKFFPKKRRRK